MVGFCFEGLSINGIMFWVALSKNFANKSLALLQSSCSSFSLIPEFFDKLLSLTCLPPIATKKSLVRSVLPKLQSLILLVTRRIVLLGHCTQCSIFSTKSKNGLNYQIAKKQSAPKPDVTFKRKICYQEFPGFYAWHQYRYTQHGFPTRTVNSDPYNILNAVDDVNLKYDLRSCQPFLVDLQLGRARKKIQICPRKTQRHKSGQEIWSLFQQLKVCSESESIFCILFEKYKVRRIQLILRRRK